MLLFRPNLKLKTFVHFNMWQLARKLCLKSEIMTSQNKLKCKATKEFLSTIHFMLDSGSLNFVATPPPPPPHFIIRSLNLLVIWSYENSKLKKKKKYCAQCWRKPCKSRDSTILLPCLIRSYSRAKLMNQMVNWYGTFVKIKTELLTSILNVVGTHSSSYSYYYHFWNKMGIFFRFTHIIYSVWRWVEWDRFRNDQFI